MALKQQEPSVQKIDGMTFYITPFPAFKAAKLSGELASVLAPVFGVLLPLLGLADTDGEGNKVDLMDVDMDKVIAAVSGATSIDGDALEKLARNLLLGGHIAIKYEDENGEQVTETLDADIVNEVFCGEVQNLYVLCYYVIRLNFKGFFKNAAARFGAEKSAQQVRKII